MLSEVPGQGTIFNIPFLGSALTTRSLLSTGDSQTLQSVFYRDAQGRTRIEQTGGTGDPWATKTSDVTIRIVDPVSGCVYVLDKERKTGFTMGIRSLPFAIQSPKQSETAKQVTVTDLGTRVILGFNCTGTQTTRTHGSTSHGSVPTTVVVQQWYSEELKLVLKSTVVDSTKGSLDFQFQLINRTLPDPSLFAPSSDFVVFMSPSMRSKPKN